MSYARSPRFVCSTTMGTSVVACGVISSVWFIWFFRLRGGTPAGSTSILLGYCPSPGIAAEPIQSFFTPDLRFHPIQRPLPCQVRANGCGGFATPLRNRRNFFFHFFIGHVDLFRRRDPVQQQLRLHILDGTIFLPAAQR